MSCLQKCSSTDTISSSRHFFRIKEKESRVQDIKELVDSLPTANKANLR